MLKNRSVYSLVVSGTSLAKLSAHVGEHYFQNTAGPKRKDTGRPKCNVVHRKVLQYLLRTMCTRAEHIGGEVLQCCTHIRIVLQCCTNIVGGEVSQCFVVLYVLRTMCTRAEHIVGEVLQCCTHIRDVLQCCTNIVGGDVSYCFVVLYVLRTTCTRAEHMYIYYRRLRCYSMLQYVVVCYSMLQYLLRTMCTRHRTYRRLRSERGKPHLVVSQNQPGSDVSCTFVKDSSPAF